MEDISLYSRWLDVLLASGYRLTNPRRALINIMASSDHALSPLDLYDLGRKNYPGLGLVTVYRTLEKLEELKLIQRVHLPNGCHRYLRAFKGHEHLLLCTACGYAEFFRGEEVHGLINMNASRTGFLIKDHWLQLFGLCSQCQVSDNANG